MYFTATQALLAQGLDVLHALLTAAVPAVPVAVLAHIATATYDRRAESRSNHARFIVSNAVTPTLVRLKEDGHEDVTSFIRAFDPGGHVFLNPPSLPPINEDNAWRWLMEHEQGVRASYEALKRAQAAAANQYRNEAEPLRARLLEATGLEDVPADWKNLPNPGQMRTASTVNTLLWKVAWLRYHGGPEPDSPTTTTGSGGGLHLWVNSVVSHCTDETAKTLRAALRDAARDQSTADSVDRLRDSMNGITKARGGLIERLERVAGDGQLRGRCVACRWP